MGGKIEEKDKVQRAESEGQTAKREVWREKDLAGAFGFGGRRPLDD